MELLILSDALRRSSARRITAVIPYFGYARQDRKSASRTPISAKLVANLITEAGVNRVITLDLHAAQIQGFFDIPTDNLYGAPVMVRDIQEHYTNGNLMIVSPDVGGVARARATAQRIGADLAIVDKRRPRAGVSEVMNIIGDVAGHACILIDDIVDSGGTLVNAAEALLKAGATEVSAYITHGVLSEGAAERIAEQQAQGTGDHRLDRRHRRHPRRQEHPPHLHRPPDGRSHRPHRQRTERLEPAGLRAGHRPLILPRVAGEGDQRSWWRGRPQAPRPQ